MSTFSAHLRHTLILKKLRNFAGRRRKFQFSYPQIALDRSLFLLKFWVPGLGGGDPSPISPPQPTPKFLVLRIYNINTYDVRHFPPKSVFIVSVLLESGDVPVLISGAYILQESFATISGFARGVFHSKHHFKHTINACTIQLVRPTCFNSEQHPKISTSIHRRGVHKQYSDIKRYYINRITNPS